MNDQLDNDLKNRIIEVFDNFEDPSADAGWLLLRERFPAEQKKRPVAWLWRAGAAAALLLFLGIGFWLLNKNPQQTNVVAVNPVKKQQPTTADANNAPAQTPATKNTPADAIAPAQTSIAQTSIAQTKQPASTQKPVINNTPNNNTPPALTPPANTFVFNKPASVATGNNPPVNNNTAPTLTVPANTFAFNKPASVATGNNPPVNNPAGQPAYANAVKPTVRQPATNPVTNTPAAKGTDSVKSAVQTPQYAVTKPAVQGPTTVAAASATKTSTIAPPAKKQVPANSMAAIFAAETNQPKKEIKEDDNEKRVRFSIYAATFFNYAKGSANQVNAGAGFTSDIKLSKNIKFSTGLALAQNTLSYSGSLPPTPNSRVMAADVASVPQKTEAFAASAAFPVYKNYNANLVGLDIPMNIKYEFTPNKSDAYISAGLSSGTFINEAYTTSYGLPDKSLAAGVSQQTTDDVTRKSFDGFYFAKTLNVSFGIGTALGKSNRLIIEPFLKYPLSGLGAQQIKFGAGGLNLKLNFTTKK
ncbi:hypothetical protein SAMN05216464_102293 [Mucilaginibacter pineti]|uniref:Outer membrane protein beta-barrel domain-containing protein n=1 Tax=Mucilaginibacter pineti TaxID=1391627 RepID=A0A1G6WTS0_9SPHI|nr:hypothetical protein [Mucilaginibacter pineti]SDD69221.1 hypothetical protein SAMN05216464_102293 [Mucilaginibacter pineti]